jgi:tRNA pseudouridine38-40 synthase
VASLPRLDTRDDRLPGRTFRLALAYDGTAYRGWQVQPDAPTVQGCLLAAAARVLGDPVRVTGASRTDAGVHAVHQVASLVTTGRIAARSLAPALNAHLPADIRVLDAREVDGPFDARRAARGKRYAYLIDNGAIASPLLRRYSWHVRPSLDIAAMRAAVRLLRGTHDFSAFCASAGRDRSPVCTVTAAHVVRKKRWIGVVLSADSFLHHMVRTVVGSLVEVGRGRRDPAWLGRVLEARDRAGAGPTAPARGLVLVRVTYGRTEVPASP